MKKESWNVMMYRTIGEQDRFGRYLEGAVTSVLVLAVLADTEGAARIEAKRQMSGWNISHCESISIQ